MLGDRAEDHGQLRDLQIFCIYKEMAIHACFYVLFSICNITISEVFGSAVIVSPSSRDARVQILIL